MNKTRSHSTILLILLMMAGSALANPGGQTPSTGSTESPEIRARQAMDRGDYLQAISILNSALADHPTPDLFLTLGNIYRRTRDYQKAEDTLTTAAKQYPNDPRIPFELANTYLAANDVDGARNQLQRTIEIEPKNIEAADLLAAVELSEGEVQTALHYWNATGYPIVNHVFHNSNVGFGNWTVREASAFRVGKMMTYSQWRTTQMRLFETNLFSNVGIAVEPAPEKGKYNPVILTTDRTNDIYTVGFGILKGTPIRTSYLDFWNLGGSGISINSSFRWDANRERGEVNLHTPLPVPGLLFLTSSGLWRSELWNLQPQLQNDAGNDDSFEYNATGVGAELKFIPNFRFEVGAGLSYTNRAASGGPSQLLLINSQNVAKILYEGSLRLADRRYQNRLHAEGYVAWDGIIGDLNYSAATVELDNRYLISRDTQFLLDWTVKAGFSTGQIPVEDYFVLGVDTHSPNLLRGHSAARHGHYGNAPMGTSFGLANFTAERRVAILPLFNTLNLPYLDVKVEFFLDTGRTWDRANIFKHGTLLVDTGAGLSFGTPTNSLNLIFGRPLRGGNNVYIINIGKKW